MLKNIFAELNKTLDLKKSLTTVLRIIRKFTSIEAMAIRLEENMDYTYYVFDGFPEDFIKRENSIVVTDKKGNKLMYPAKKRFQLVCMCGNVIEGRFDPSMFFLLKMEVSGQTVRQN